VNRIGFTFLAFMVASCASTAGPGAGAWAPPANEVGPIDEGRIGICVTSAKFEGNVYGVAAFQSGIREAFRDPQLPAERRGPGQDEWVGSEPLPNPFRLAACDGAPGAPRLELVLGLTSPLYERPVATPWGETSQPSGVGCRMTLSRGDAGADSVRSRSFSVFYRGWNAPGGSLTADMGRRFGEVLLGRLYAEFLTLPPDTRVRPPDVWQASSW